MAVGFGLASLSFALPLALSLSFAAGAQVPSDTVRQVIAPPLTDSLSGRHPTAQRDSVTAPALRDHVRPGTFAGSRQEAMLRTLQLLGSVPVHQWSIRAFGPEELEQLAAARGMPLPRSMARALCTEPCDVSSPVRAGVLPAEGAAWFNSTRPFGANDGVVWAGRGLTIAATGGVYAHAGPLSAIVAPVLTWAQNQRFVLRPNNEQGELRFADAVFPTSIDHPQRYGDAPYTRIDPGESTIRVDLLGAAAGLSTASQWWGPMQVYPYLLGNNAGGFPHAFFGTSSPLDVGLGKVHGRVMYGSLGESDYSSMPDSGSRRFASGLAFVFTPRPLPGLEVGFARFFHSDWPSGGLGRANFETPFDGLLKIRTGLADDGGLREDVHNQLAAVFFRLHPPGSGVEIYGEFGRDDHNADMRDFWLQPDHNATYGLGLRRAWRAGTSVSVFSTEFANFRTSHLTRVRGQAPPYVHSELRQGHTHRGQPLGISMAARAGDVAMVEYQRHGNSGAWTYRLSRHADGTIGEGTPRIVQVMGMVERSLVRGPLDIGASATVAHYVRRGEETSGTNLNVALRVQWVRPPTPARVAAAGPRPSATIPAPTAGSRKQACCSRAAASAASDGTPIQR